MTAASHRNPRRLPQRLSRMDAWRKWQLLVEANTRLTEEREQADRHDDGPEAA